VIDLTLSQSEAIIEEGGTLKLIANVAPDYATDKRVVWSTSDADVAIAVKGVVVGLTPGTATITAKAGDVEATCVVTVEKRYIPVASVVLNKNTATVIEGDTLVLTATVRPDNAEDKTVTWTSSDETLATVSDGQVITLAPGKVTITATAGGQTASCYITIEERFIPVSEVVLNPAEATIEVGEKIVLSATVLPENATKKTIVWKSSSSKIASVRNGTVVGVAEGTATITAKSGDVEGTCVITVKLADNIEAVTGGERFTIYDITGRPIKTDATSTKGLQQGIYIINGRKTVVK
jgi:uncharacterized protein YjdB